MSLIRPAVARPIVSTQPRPPSPPRTQQQHQRQPSPQVRGRGPQASSHRRTQGQHRQQPAEPIRSGGWQQVVSAQRGRSQQITIAGGGWQQANQRQPPPQENVGSTDSLTEVIPQVDGASDISEKEKTLQREIDTLIEDRRSAEGLLKNLERDKEREAGKLREVNNQITDREKNISSGERSIQHTQGLIDEETRRSLSYIQEIQKIQGDIHNNNKEANDLALKQVEITAKIAEKRLKGEDSTSEKAQLQDIVNKKQQLATAASNLLASRTRATTNQVESDKKIANLKTLKQTQESNLSQRKADLVNLKRSKDSLTTSIKGIDQQIKTIENKIASISSSIISKRQEQREASRNAMQVDGTEDFSDDDREMSMDTEDAAENKKESPERKPTIQEYQSEPVEEGGKTSDEEDDNTFDEEDIDMDINVE